MSEYIDRYEAIMAMRKTIWSKIEVHPTLDRDEVENVLFDIPSADVEPVRHGRWITKGQDFFCSVCGEESAYNWHGASKFSNYCPTCGARMDGE